MKYKAIIFDMDGTIIDTDHIWKQANRELISRRGIEVSPELAHELSCKLNGMALPQSCKIIKDIVCLPDPIEELVKEKSKIACDLYATGIRFIDGFIDFHSKALIHNLKMGIATNADDNTLLITNQVLNLGRFFGNHMYNISHVNNVGKPNPAIYLHAASMLGVDPAECLAIEDSAHGIRAAQAAGMFCIGINSSGDLAQTQAAHKKIDRYGELDLHALLYE